MALSQTEGSPKPMTRTQAISDAVFDVLTDATFLPGNMLRFEAQLDRKLYLDVNKALEALGGTWNRKAKAHTFDVDPRPAIEEALLTGTYRPSRNGAPIEFDFFPTSPELASTLAVRANIYPDDDILEPSAGDGALVRAIRTLHPDAHVECFEINEALHPAIRKAGAATISSQDFLQAICADGLGYERIVMNPPFTRQADIDHVIHAFEHWLRPEGRLVAIMSTGIAFRTNRKAVEFRALVDRLGGTIERNSDDAFTHCGTSVRTVMVVLNKPSDWRS